MTKYIKTEYGWAPEKSPEVRKDGKRVRIDAKQLSDKPPRMSLWGKIKSLFTRRTQFRYRSMEAATSQPCYVTEEEE
ncbi:MAG: hypothetical protein CL489_06685 [Acidobacteria bacterium]|nr:hypothetical protein [Acidobacteriota bacterium]